MLADINTESKRPSTSLSRGALVTPSKDGGNINVSTAFNVDHCNISPSKIAHKNSQQDEMKLAAAVYQRMPGTGGCHANAALASGASTPSFSSRMNYQQPSQLYCSGRPYSCETASHACLANAGIRKDLSDLSASHHAGFSSPERSIGGKSGLFYPSDIPSSGNSKVNANGVSQRNDSSVSGNHVSGFSHSSYQALPARKKFGGVSNYIASSKRKG